jgi:hypothetical protein
MLLLHAVTRVVPYKEDEMVALLHRVIIHPSKVEMEIRSQSLIKLLKIDCDHLTCDDKVLCLNVPAHLKRFGGEVRFRIVPLDQRDCRLRSLKT